VDPSAAAAAAAAVAAAGDHDAPRVLLYDVSSLGQGRR
jgi:hypothetical protein